VAIQNSANQKTKKILVNSIFCIFIIVMILTYKIPLTNDTLRAATNMESAGIFYSHNGNIRQLRPSRFLKRAENTLRKSTISEASFVSFSASYSLPPTPISNNNCLFPRTFCMNPASGYKYFLLNLLFLYFEE
jgi:hypothetical protein